jgi:ferredoxin
MVINLSEPDFLTQSNCIRCGRCVKLCPTGARRWRLGFGGKPAAETKEPELVPEPAIWTDAPR